VKSLDDNADPAARGIRAITSGLLSRDVLLQVSTRDFYAAFPTPNIPSSSRPPDPADLARHLSSPPLSSGGLLPSHDAVKIRSHARRIVSPLRPHPAISGGGFRARLRASLGPPWLIISASLQKPAN